MDSVLEKKVAGGARCAGGKDSVKSGKGAESPAWAPALQQIYGTVLDEALPKEIEDLLSKLDDKS